MNNILNLGIAGGLIGLIGIIAYNSIINMIEAVNNNKHQIDIQLDLRFKTYESLISVVNKYFSYESTTLKDIVALRTQAQLAKADNDEVKRQHLEDQISQLGSSLHINFERYPDLKANNSVLSLQESIATTENKLAFAKQAYNSSVETYNAKIKSFPNLLLGKIFSQLRKDFPYWQLSPEQQSKADDYKITM